MNPLADTPENTSLQAPLDTLARLTAILDNVLDSIITINEECIIETFNRSAERMFGYSAYEVIGKNVNMLMPEPFHSQHDEYVNNYLTSGIRRVIGIGRNVIGKHKNGVEFPMNLAVSEMKIGDKRMFTGIVRDLTFQNETLKAKRDGEARLAAILDNVFDGIITINDRGIIESFNRAAQAIFGYLPREVIGRNVKVLMPEPYHSQHDGYIHNYIGSGIRKIIGIGREVVGQRKDGSIFPMDLAVTEMWVGEQRMFTGIVRDITERAKVEKMKQEFVSTVSHELRTPLTSIRGSLGLLAGGVAGQLPSQAQNLVKIANQNSERLILLVNDILDMEKIESGKMEFKFSPVHLPSFLQKATESHAAYAQQYQVKYQLSHHIPDVGIYVDEHRLNQVLSNLMSNAAKFSSAGDIVEINAIIHDQTVRIEVSDHGSGIPLEFRTHIFQKFAQADASNVRKKGGTGLGLSITKAIVEQMHGNIGFNSEPNVLTTFFIDFPIHQSPKDQENTEGFNSQKTPNRILVCESNPNVAMLLQLMLEHEGFIVDMCNQAQQAQQMLQTQEYAAMTLDLALPDQCGISLVQNLRNHHQTASLPILIVAAHAELAKQDKLKGNAFKLIDWIHKPIDQTALLSSLRSLIKQVNRKRLQILHVEDDLLIYEFTKALVGELASIDNVTTLELARKQLQQQVYDLIILDIGLPDGSGLELLNDIRAIHPQPSVMVFSAQENHLESIAEIKSVLIKSKTDSQQLFEQIKALLTEH